MQQALLSNKPHPLPPPQHPSPHPLLGEGNFSSVSSIFLIPNTPFTVHLEQDNKRQVLAQIYTLGHKKESKYDHY